MIIDRLDARNEYRISSLPNLSRAFDWLIQQDFETLEDGKYPILGDDVFAIVNRYETKEEGKWEAHRSYADLQYVASGAELMGYAPLPQMEEIQAYSESDDYALFDGDGEFLVFQEGMFAIFLPGDVHMPGIMLEDSAPVCKVVIKIRLQPPAELVMATGNPHKLAEVSSVLGADFLLRTAIDAGFRTALKEDGDTLEANAMQKAEQVFQATGLACIADDTGLFTEALNGEPGVFSARFAGEDADDAKNRDLLVARMDGATNRKACFKTVIAYISETVSFTVIGEVWGTILPAEQGTGGFGYDSLFVPDGYTQSFAELHAAEKNRISHRAKALTALCSEFATRGIKH